MEVHLSQTKSSMVPQINGHITLGIWFKGQPSILTSKCCQIARTRVEFSGLRKISQSRKNLNWLKVKSNDLILKSTFFWVSGLKDRPLTLHQSAVRSRVRVSHSGDLEKFRRVGKI